MATPVPVVSMMYFLVSTPPKTSIIVRPASFAMSIKYARGLGGRGFWLLDRPIATASETGNRIDRQIRHAREWPRDQEGFLKIMSHRHSRLRPHGGQGGQRREDRDEMKR